MQIVYHLGGHNTDNDRLVKTLLMNKKSLEGEGIVVPGPARYRPLLRETIQALRGSHATPEIQEIILDATMDVDQAHRLILSNENFICIPDRMLSGGRIYPNAAEKTQWLRRVFPEMQVEFFMATCNMATFAPTIAKRIKAASPREFFQVFDPRKQSWERVVRDIIEANPDAELTVWCNEDTPLIWPEVLAAVTGREGGTPLIGTDDLLNSILSPEGVTRMEAYLTSHPPATEDQRRRIVAAFLDKYALEEELEEELDLPGWTEALVDELTDLYEQDIYEMSRVPGVKIIAP